MGRAREADARAGDRLIQGRVWQERLPRREVPQEGAEERYRWWTGLHPSLFDPRRFAGGPVPENMGKGCVVCLMDTRDTDLHRCPRCRRNLIWVSFESLPY